MKKRKSISRTQGANLQKSIYCLLFQEGRRRKWNSDDEAARRLMVTVTWQTFLLFVMIADDKFNRRRMTLVKTERCVSVSRVHLVLLRLQKRQRDTERKRQIFLKDHPTHNCIKGKRVGCVVVVVVEEDRVVVAIRDLVEWLRQSLFEKKESLQLSVCPSVDTK